MISRLRRGAFALLAAALVAGAAPGQPVPSQAEWAGRKASVALPNGVTLAYVDAGDARSRPVLLIHGYTDNSRSWSLVMTHLPKDRRMLAVDLRGHGKSSAPACCYTLADFSSDLALFLDALAVEKVDVVGHSLGAMTAAVFAAQHPERVGKLVLVSASLAVGGGPGSWLWDNILPLEPPLDPASQFMTDWYWNPNPVDPDFIEREKAESAAVPKQVWLGVLWSLTMTDLTPIAPLVTAPTLVLWGDQDGLFDAASQERLRAALPAARFETFQGYGHNMFWEAPERAAALIADFLAE